VRGWRPALRLAWRDVLRARGRSVLVLIMIALPVLAVTAASVIQATQDLDGIEGAQRRMGAADARIRPVGGGVIYQSPDPEEFGWGNGPGGSDDAPTFADVTDVLGPDISTITLRMGYTEIPLGDKRITVAGREVDLRDPLAKGLFTVTAGRAPESVDEAVINDTLRERGVAIGDTVTVGETELEVVGTGRDATTRDMAAMVTLPDGLGEGFADMNSDLDWLVDGGDVSWAQVRAMNAAGLLVTSRAVLADPPPAREMVEQMGYDSGYDDYIAIVALIITMALLEVVLLAGPAFAVGARRQARTLALLAASGATPRQARRVILASGVVIGLVAASIGAVAGVVIGWALLPFVQRYNGDWFGPLDVDWRIIAVVAAFGVLSAFLAAVVPAWLASRQDVVAVLAGRRGDRPPSARTPVLGLVLLGIGVAMSAYGAVEAGSRGSYLIAVGAIVAVLGMILVAGLVISLVARLGRRFPLVLRYAVRDAARHRTRTVPAVAAVAATVAGVVALGIATTSDEAQNKANYEASQPMGTGTVNVSPTYGMDGTTTPPTERQWSEVEALVRSRVPGVEVVQGVPQSLADGSNLTTDFRVPGQRRLLLDGWGGTLSTSVLVAGTVPGLVDLDDAQRALASRALADGKAVVFSTDPVDSDVVKVRIDRWDPSSEKSEVSRLTWPAVFVQVPQRYPLAQAIAPEDLAAQIGEAPQRAGLYLGTVGLNQVEETDLKEELRGISENASIYVERGYQAPDEVVIIQLILAALGGVLMLGGTLTATFLALSDARPDLATLSAVGAAPRSRRGVAASYALVVGFVGAVLGALVGFIPGLAITRPLTYQAANYYGSDGVASGPYVDIPWLLILGLVVALPLLTALIVGLTARSRLPLSARLT
jgi:putative ABC transport system permease protein